MLNPDQILGAIEDLEFCAECYKDLNPKTDKYSQCFDCDELLCAKCSHCACDRVAATV
jgi:hypothetical protein